MDIKKVILKNKKSVSYMTVNLFANDYLNVQNLESISKEKIKKIEKLFEPDFFYVHKKRLFWKWDKANFENTIKYYKKFFKLIDKLDLKMLDYENDKIYLYKAKYFTKVRNLKTIEAPYKNEMLELIIYFYYKNVYLYKNVKNFFEKQLTSDLSISKKEIVFFNSDLKKIEYVIYLKNIKKIRLEYKWIKIILNNNEEYFLRYIENEIIFISLRRLWDEELFD